MECIKFLCSFDRFSHSSFVTFISTCIGSCYYNVLTDRNFNTSFSDPAGGVILFCISICFGFWSPRSLHFNTSGFWCDSHVVADYSNRSIFGYLGMVMLW